MKPPAEAASARLALKLQPGASRNALLGWHGDALKLAVTAVPERGRANAAACALLAEQLGVAKSAVQLVQGATHTQKVFSIRGLSATELRQRLVALGFG